MARSGEPARFDVIPLVAAGCSWLWQNPYVAAALQLVLQVFICYRNEDTGQTAARLAFDLRRNLNADVFIDYSSIEPGEPWPSRIRQEVERSVVMFVLIGKAWLTLQDTDGVRRLDDPEDWVRQEIALALKASCTVVPVLVDGAAPVQRRALRTVPEIAALSELQPTSLTAKDWVSDFEKIASLLRQRGFGSGEPRSASEDVQPPERDPLSPAAPALPQHQPTAASITPASSPTWGSLFAQLGGSLFHAAEVVAEGYTLKVLLDRATERKAAGDWKVAQQTFDTVAKQAMALAERYQRKAAVANDKGESSDAKSSAGQAATYRRVAVTGLAARAEIQQQEEDLAGAREAYDLAIGLAPDNAELYYRRGVVRERQCDPVAREDYKKANELNPGLAEDFRRKAEQRQAADELLAAQELYDAAIRLRPRFPRALEQRAKVLELLGDTGGALKDRFSAHE